VFVWADAVKPALGVVGRRPAQASCNFNYYDRAGDATAIHVDEPRFSVNMLTLLEHSGPSKASDLGVLSVATGEFTWTSLVEGETVIFHGRSAPHVRTPLNDDERVRIVSFGYAFEV
jgi:hypothetical protein